MPDIDATLVAGVEAGGYRTGATSGDPWYQYVVTKRDRLESWAGRGATNRIAGIAGTAGQKLLSIFNAAGSAVLVDVETVTCDVYQTAAKVVAPPILRLHRVTTAPTGGTAIPKVPNDTAQSSSASVTVLQASSSDSAGTASAITSTVAMSGLITQEPVARALTLVGYEQFDRIEFINDARPLLLRASEGLVLTLDYSAAGSNPVTDIYVCNLRWSEYTRP